MARTYRRDSKGRFAGGGGSRDPRGPAKVGRSGRRGGKVGTRSQQAKARKAQQARTAQFHSKAGATSAKAAYKAAARGARLSERRAAARPPARRRSAAAAVRRSAPISQASVERGIATTLRASRMLASATGSALAKVPKAQREAKRQRMQARVAARRAELARNMETVDRNDQAAAYRKMRAANKAAAREVFKRVGRTERTYPRRPRR